MNITVKDPSAACVVYFDEMEPGDVGVFAAVPDVVVLRTDDHVTIISPRSVPKVVQVPTYDSSRIRLLPSGSTVTIAIE